MSQDASKFLPIVGLFLSFCTSVQVQVCTNTFQLHPSDKQSHFKVNDCTEQKTLSIHLELIQWFTVETPSNFGRMFRICFFFPRERFQKKLHLPFQVVKISSHGPKVLLWKILVYSKYVGKKKKKNTNISIFSTTPTYLKQTFVCLFFFFFFLWTFP